jgi:hypothetical protein
VDGLLFQVADVITVQSSPARVQVDRRDEVLIGVKDFPGFLSANEDRDAAAQYRLLA